MQTFRGSTTFSKSGIRDTVITLGNFDGVHLGHQHILRTAVACARETGGASVVYTFDPHPLQLLRPDFAPLRLTSSEEQARRIAEAGIDYLVYEHFSRDFATQPPEEFIKQTIVGHLHPQHIIIGDDYRFGHNRSGDVTLLQRLGLKFNFVVHVISDIRIKNIPVRSTTLRNLISTGKVSLASKLMGRPYSLTGTVVHGKRRKIGFPTANLTPSRRDLTPANGVYAARVTTPAGIYNGIVNIGTCPTFDGNHRTIETHLFDFGGELYGQEITLAFIKRIRPERKFKDAASLAERIRKDIGFARALLSKSAPV